METENRLVLCYMLPNRAHFDAVWTDLVRLYRLHGEAAFLYQYGVRLLDAQSWLRRMRLLALVMEEHALRTMESDLLCRLADTLREHEATYVARVPEVLTTWFVDLSEWHEGAREKPSTPAGLGLIEPTEFVDDYEEMEFV